MIVKELEDVKSSDKFVQAGIAAEKQMAFYLKRAFGEEPNVLVLNGIRLVHNEDVAQIDHLVLHEYGMVIVESKSVSTQVSINEYGEWSRLINGKYSGMPSPVLQATRQGDFLKNFLQPHTETLLKKSLGIQLKFNKMPIDVIVAISDKGIIKRPKKAVKELKHVCKADQVVDNIQQLIKVYKKKENGFNLTLGPYILGKSARENISKFLLKKHSPTGSPTLEKRSTEPPSKATTESSSSKIFAFCKHCNGTRVDVVYGKYGYYLKCRECEKNTAIREDCLSCGKKLRVRKDKAMFFLECRDCGSSMLYHKNAK